MSSELREWTQSLGCAHVFPKISDHPFGTSGKIKIEAKQQHMPILFATPCQHAYTHNIKRSAHYGQPPPQPIFRLPATDRPKKISKQNAYYLLAN
jgi:hypothetical protein